jgi:hypothetical protein
LEVTDEKENSNIVAGMNNAVVQITLHYAGRKAVNWLGGIKKANSQKTFGSWSVRAIASNSNNRTDVIDLTRAN